MPDFLTVSVRNHPTSRLAVLSHAMSFLDAAEEDTGNGGEENGDGDGDVNVISHNFASSAIANLTYHRDTHDLFMTFTDGSKYVIAEFPEIELERWVGSASIGGYFNAFVRGNY